MVIVTVASGTADAAAVAVTCTATVDCWAGTACWAGLSAAACIAGQTVIASPAQPAVLQTDYTGAVVFTQPATGLDAVTFSVTGDGIAGAVPVTPYDYLHQQLAGSSPIFTGTASCWCR